MTESNDKNFSIALPGEWALQKAFGPALSELGEDLKRLYAAGRDKLLTVAYRKVDDPDDGKQANLRVTKDVLWNGAFTEDPVCAEYFGGVLASSRSEEGKDDSAIHYVDLIKALSSKQLHLHYIIYHSLNKMLSSESEPINVGNENEITRREIWLANKELGSKFGIDPHTDLHVLARQSLVSGFECKAIQGKGVILPYSKVQPTTFGVLLYAVSHAQLSKYREFSEREFEDFGDIPFPAITAGSKDELLKATEFTEVPQDEPT